MASKNANSLLNHKGFSRNKKRKPEMDDDSSGDDDSSIDSNEKLNSGTAKEKPKKKSGKLKVIMPPTYAAQAKVTHLLGRQEKVCIEFFDTTCENVMSYVNMKSGECIRVPHHRWKCKLCPNDYYETFQIKTGHSNPYRHLTHGHFNKDAEKLNAHCEKAKAASGDGTKGPLLDFISVDTRSPKQRAIVAWVNFIVKTNQPLNSIEDPDMRDFSKFPDVPLSISVLKEVLLQMVELVEERIGKDMKEAGIGSVMHDGWTKARTHCIGLLALFNKAMKSLENGKPVTSRELKIVLLAVSPLHQPHNEEDEEDMPLEAVKFAVPEMARFMIDTFRYYKNDCKEWSLNQCADNTNLNPAVAKELKIAHVGCMSHKLNLDVNEMIDTDPILSDLLENVHDVMNLSRSLKNAAILRNLTTLVVSTPNKTRWSGKSDMLAKCKRMHGSLQEAADADGSTEGLSKKILRTVAHKKSVEKQDKKLKIFNEATKLLQRRGTDATLSKCRNVMDMLMQKIETVNSDGNREHVLFNCGFKGSRVKLQGTLSPHWNFESAVCKIQSGRESELTFEERQTVRRALKKKSTSEDSYDDSVGGSGAGLGSPSLFAEVIQKEQQTQTSDVVEDTSDCVNLDFVVGSAAEIERVWSMANFILVKERNSMSPIMFEALIFLKFNFSYWDDALILKAYSKALNKQRSERLEKRLEELQEEEELES